MIDIAKKFHITAEGRGIYYTEKDTGIVRAIDPPTSKYLEGYIHVGLPGKSRIYRVHEKDYVRHAGVYHRVDRKSVCPVTGAFHMIPVTTGKLTKFDPGDVIVLESQTYVAHGTPGDVRLTSIVAPMVSFHRRTSVVLPLWEERMAAVREKIAAGVTITVPFDEYFATVGRPVRLGDVVVVGGEPVYLTRDNVLGPRERTPVVDWTLVYPDVPCDGTEPYASKYPAKPDHAYDDEDEDADLYEEEDDEND